VHPVSSISSPRGPGAAPEPRACTETYTLAGTFTSATEFAATFTAEFSGDYCFDCTTQAFNLTGALFE
jgi:hypothetical protein